MKNLAHYQRWSIYSLFEVKPCSWNAAHTEFSNSTKLGN